MKIIINTCYGGFGLSKEALALFNERSGTINISGVGVGVSNPYRAPFVYVTII